MACLMSQEESMKGQIMQEKYFNNIEDIRKHLKMLDSVQEKVEYLKWKSEQFCYDSNSGSHLYKEEVRKHVPIPNQGIHLYKEIQKELTYYLALLPLDNLKLRRSK